MRSTYFNVMTPSHKGATGIHKMTPSAFEESYHTWDDVVSVVEEKWENGRLVIEYVWVSGIESIEAR